MEPLSFSGTVFIHIGQDKTGTTSIQNFFARNSQFFAERRILYPEAGRINHLGRLIPTHHPLARAVMSADEAGLVAIRDQLDDEIARHQPQHIFISSELLTIPSLRLQGAQSFQWRFRLFPQARCYWIVYLRRQDDLVISRYQQNIKQGRLAWPKNIYSLVSDRQLNHVFFLDNLLRFIHDDTLYPVLFDKTKKDITKPILDLLEMQPDGGMELPTRQNERLPWRVIYLLRYVNALPTIAAKPTAELVQRIARFAVRHGGASWIDGRGPLSAAAQAELRAEFEPSNIELCRRYFTPDDIACFR